jgi:hypothetical protein
VKNRTRILIRKYKYSRLRMQFKAAEPLRLIRLSLLTARSYLIGESPVLSVFFRTFATHAYRGLDPRPWTATMLHLVSEYKAI